MVWFTTVYLIVMSSKNVHEHTSSVSFVAINLTKLLSFSVVILFHEATIISFVYGSALPLLLSWILSPVKRYAI
ncbi:hypothetical protein Y032_0319g2361 [Ancylostoma ceylanicum]|uniref:Uncharacterized protein n=1 Tax=Ancylostoma ceylanicum TaxID=53326 RepID=A0A016S1T2_9BILA|nr:hypothetical protein Y032_0319g2361 [Ancylostoma ceylanicum]